MLLSSYSARLVAPFRIGPQDAIHDTVEIVWVTRGRIGGLVDGIDKVIDADHFELIAPDTLHSSWTLEEEVESHVLHLFAPPGGLRVASGLYPLGGAVRTILRAFPEPTAPRLELERAARALLDELGGLSAPAGSPVDERLRRVVWSLAHDPTAPVTLDELARRAHMSRHHFARAFQRALGIPPMAYVRRLRVERAALLLASTSRSVAEIAFASGFSSAGRLSEAFRAHFGVAPSAWREAQRAERSPQSS